MTAKVTVVPQLAPHHAKLITGSAITTEVSDARGYFTATTKAELKRLGFADYQQIVPALVVPVYGVTGEIVNYQIRPDRPRVPRSKNGKKNKPLKYETVAESRIRLDVPPIARQWLRDPGRALFITEGARKADSAVSRGLCCVALLGVWNWRGTNEEGGKVALEDWESVALNVRKIYIGFDSDVTEKRDVHRALKRFKAFLESRGAHVMMIYLPTGEGGAKVGLDDYFAAGHSVDDLLSHATDKLKLPDFEDRQSNPAMPRGFRLDDSGIHAVEMEDDGEERPIFVCSPLKITATIRSDEAIEWGRLLEWPDPDGNKHQWAMPLSELSADGSAYRARLLSEGVLIAPGRKARDLLTAYIMLSSPKQRATCVCQPGWHGLAFIYPDESINQPDGERLILQTPADFTHLFKSNGTVDDWKSQVSQYCGRNSILCFSVSVAFAAKLLKPLNVESGGFNFRGRSSKGKTTVLQVAASVEGCGDATGKDSFVEGWKATSNGLESVCERHNDAILPLDELAQCEPHVAAEAAYLIPNGQGKHRMARSVTARRRLTWRTLFISNGEISLADHLAQIGRRTKAGQEVRVLDIPVGDRQHGVFDNLHTFGSGQDLANHLKLSAGRYYGTAGREFVRRLTAHDPDFSGTQKAFKSFLDYFIKNALTEEEGGQPAKIEASSEVTRAATRFALVAFAGETATEYGVTGWEGGEAERAALELFKHWLATRGTSGGADDEAIVRQIRAFIEAHGSSRFENGDPDRTVINRVGFQATNSAGEVEFCFFTEAFKREACVGFDPQHAARVLRDRGYLVTNSEKDLTVKRSVRDEGRPRVYAVKETILESGRSGRQRPRPTSQVGQSGRGRAQSGSGKPLQAMQL